MQSKALRCGSGDECGKRGDVVMRRWWRDLDRFLRGEATRLSALRRGTVEVEVGGLAWVLVVLAMSYGVCMGCFAVLKSGGPSIAQVAATMVKVPLLFFLT